MDINDVNLIEKIMAFTLSGSRPMLYGSDVSQSMV